MAEPRCGKTDLERSSEEIPLVAEDHCLTVRRLTLQVKSKQGVFCVAVYTFKIFEFKAGLMVYTKSSRSTRAIQ